MGKTSKLTGAWMLVLAWSSVSACSSTKGEDNGTVGGSTSQANTTSPSATDIGGTGGTVNASVSAKGGERASTNSIKQDSSATGGKGAGTGGSSVSTNVTSGGSSSSTNVTSGGSSVSTNATSGGSSVLTTTPAGGATTSSSPSAEPSAQELLDKVAACSATATAVKSGFGLDGGSGDLSMYQCDDAVYWKADMDVDCDGIQTPPCDTDEQGQPQTSIVDDAPNGDVDPTKLPYFVIPLGQPETTWYKQVGIDLGQVGAVTYKGSVRYGIFADEAGGAFIGEASYAMCQLFLGKPTSSKDPCDPNEGGIDPAEVTYITFTGAANRATGTDIYSHDKHTAMGVVAAKAWLAP